MTLIDTSAWIHALRSNGDAAVKGRVIALLQSGEAAWCGMIRLELWNGARGEHEKRMLRDFERDLPELAIDSAVWRLADDLARRARAAGQTIPSTDLLIAACARQANAAIEHDDDHFNQLGKLV